MILQSSTHRKRFVCSLTVGLLVVCSLATHNLAAQKLRFTTRWTPQAQFAGFYVAQEMGFYKSVGLDVEIKHPTASVNSIELMRNNLSDLADFSLTDALIARNNGIELVNVMQIFQRSALVLVADRPIHNDLTRLGGLRIGKWRAGHSQVAIMAFKNQHVDVQWYSFISGPDLFLSGAVNAMLAMSYNELIAIKSSGRKIDASQIVHMANLGYNIIEDGVYVTAQYAAQHHTEIDKFRQATIRGWLWAHKNPEKALDIVMKYVDRYQVPTNRYHQSIMLKEILALAYPIGSPNISFTLNRENFDFANRMLFKSKDIGKLIPYESFIMR